MPVKPFGPGRFPDPNVSRDVKAFRRGGAQLSEIGGATSGIDNGVFVAAAGRAVEDIILDLGIIERINVPGVTRDQKDVIFKHEPATFADVLRDLEKLVVTGRTTTAHRPVVGPFLRLQSDQRVLYFEGVGDVLCTLLLFAAGKPSIRPINQYIVNRAVVKAVVFYAVVPGMTDVRSRGTTS